MTSGGKPAFLTLRLLGLNVMQVESLSTVAGAKLSLHHERISTRYCAF